MKRQDLHKPEIVINCNYKDLNPITTGYARTIPPSGNCGPAIWKRWVLHYVVSGSGLFEKDGKVHNVKAGQIFVIPPYIQVSYRPDINNPWEYIWIGFTAGIELPEIMSEPVITCPEARDVFEDIKNCGSYDSGKSAYLTSCLWRLISLFMEKGSRRKDYIDKALSFIHAHYSNNISVTMLANSLNLDRKYFSALFKKQVGSSPSSYIKAYRLTKAAEFMTVDNASPSVAAASVGIDDLFYFSKIFKNHFGCSPREYIKKHKNTLE